MDEVRQQKFRTLNSYIKITKKVSIAFGIIACIPLLISGGLAAWSLFGLGEMAFTDHVGTEIEDILPFLVKCLIFLGISFSIAYAAILLLVISELIQCFLAIEENTYQSAQNTSSNQSPSANQPTD